MKILELPLAYDEQNGYLREDGIVGTLTTDGSSPKHNNRVVEEYIGVGVHPVSKKLEFDGYKDGECPTLLATDYKCPKTVAFAEPMIMDDIYNSREPRITPNCPTIRADREGLKVIEPIVYDDYNSKVRADQDTIGTLTTNCGNDAPRNGWKIIEPTQKIRVRKLTARECGRLMGVKNEDIDKIGKNLSKSAQYHCYGDSIACPCLMAIFGEMLDIDYRKKIDELLEDITGENK